MAGHDHSSHTYTCETKSKQFLKYELVDLKYEVTNVYKNTYVLYFERNLADISKKINLSLQKNINSNLKVKTKCFCPSIYKY